MNLQDISTYMLGSAAFLMVFPAIIMIIMIVMMIKETIEDLFSFFKNRRRK